MEVYLSDWFDYMRNEVPVCARVIEGIQWGKDEIVFIEKTRDTWLRDFMPVKTKSGKYIAFAYKPIYLEGYPDLCTNFQKILRYSLQLMILRIQKSGWMAETLFFHHRKILRSSVTGSF